MGQTGKAQFRGKIAASFDCKFWRIVIAEGAARVVDTKIIEKCGRKQVSLADYRLSGIAVRSAIPVDVAAETFTSNGGNISISEVDRVLGSEVVIDARRISHLILLYKTIHYIILHKAVCVSEVRSSGRHELQRLQGSRIEKILRNHIAWKWVDCCGRFPLTIYQIVLLINRAWSNGRK